LADKCANNAECYLPDDGSDQHVECAEGQCKCTAGYDPTPDNRNCKGKLLIHGAYGTQPKVEPTYYLYQISQV